MELFIFYLQAEDGIRAHCVTGVQTCALPISKVADGEAAYRQWQEIKRAEKRDEGASLLGEQPKIGRASCRERVWSRGDAVSIRKKRSDASPGRSQQWGGISGERNDSSLEQDG